MHRTTGNAPQPRLDHGGRVYTALHRAYAGRARDRSRDPTERDDRPRVWGVAALMGVLLVTWVLTVTWWLPMLAG